MATANPMPPRTKHRAIFEILQREIVRGDYTADGRLPSELTLVRRFKASRPTVARAMNDLRLHGLVDRRPGAGTTLRRPDVRQGGLFGLVGAGLGHTEILGPIGTDIERAAQAQGCRLLLGDAGSAESDATTLCRTFRRCGVAGVFLAPLEVLAGRELVNRRMVEALAEAGIPVVLLDRDIFDFPGRSGLDLIAIDDVRAAYRLAQHVLTRGCRRIAFVARPSPPSTTDLRIAGARAAIALVGDATLQVHLGDPQDATFAADLVGRHGHDAVICANDLTAAQLMRSLAGRRITVPQRVRIAGFDDVQHASRLPIPLTTMRLPCRELGLIAVRTMLERIREPGIPARQILLDAQLVVRRSTARR
jgi:GntR family transcriptional regulator, arabinose operon transcriptional repressor